MAKVLSIAYRKTFWLFLSITGSASANSALTNCVSQLRIVRSVEHLAVSRLALGPQFDKSTAQYAAFEREASEVFDFVGVQERRRSWAKHPQIMKALSDSVRDDLAFSVYYVVRDTSQKKEPIVGSLRLVESPFASVFSRNTQMTYVMSLQGLREADYSEEGFAESSKKFPPNRLPGERILGKQFPRENVMRPLNFKSEAGSFDIGISRIVEPGFFAIQKKHGLRKQILLALHSELYLYHNSESHLFAGQAPRLTDDKATYFSYGDKSSVNLYQPLGFMSQETTHSVFPYALFATSEGLIQGFLKLPAERQISESDWRDAATYIDDNVTRSYPLWTIEDY